MSKIGIKITKISGGVQDLETFNGGEWTRKVSDIRTEMKLIGGKAWDEGAPVLMLSFLNRGSITTVCHAIPGRAGDLVSAWIYIPAEIVVPAEEEVAIIEQVKAELAKSDVENWDALGKLCEKEYPNKPMAFFYRESVSTNPCAVRYYGAGTDFELRELLGNLRYQSCYADHRYVFLIDKATGITADDKLVNYTGDPVRETILVAPPKLPAGITARINETEFTKPKSFLKGDKFPLTFDRPGFNSLTYTLSAGDDLPDPATFPWQRHITPNLFYITDNEGKDLNVSNRIIIMLNGKHLTPDGISIPENECNAVKVNVTCPEYEPYSDTHDLLPQTPLRIKLERVKLDILYRIDGTDCPGLTHCPTGYQHRDIRQGKKLIRECYYEEPEPGPNWKLFTIIGSAAALVIGLILGILIHKIIANRTEKTEPQTEIVTDNPDTQKAKSSTDTAPPQPVVYDCLNKDVWKKIEIDNELDLQGFFRDVQKCNVERLTGYWAEKINPQYHPKWASLLNELKNYDAEVLKDFQMGNNEQEIRLQYYISELNKWGSAHKQSGTAMPATPPKQNTNANANANKTNAKPAAPGDNATSQGKKKETNQSDL